MTKCPHPLTDLAQKRLNLEGCEPRHSLQALCKRVLKVDLLKPRAIQCGNWEAEKLTPAQRSYAALDAMASLQVFQSLVLLPQQDRRKALPPDLVAPVNVSLQSTAGVVGGSPPHTSATLPQQCITPLSVPGPPAQFFNSITPSKKAL